MRHLADGTVLAATARQYRSGHAPRLNPPLKEAETLHMKESDQ
jgi:hypothetical protein